MKLAKLFTLGFVALSFAGSAHAKAAGCVSPMQVTEQESDSKVDSATQVEDVQGAEESTPEDSNFSEEELELIFGGRTLIAGSEVDLDPVARAEWIQGEAPESFEPGKVYIFECWSTKCGPCMAMIPHVNELHKKYYDKGLRIYGMSVYENDKQECMDFVKEKGDGMSYPVAFTGKGGPFEAEWMGPAGAKGIPHAFIVRDGKLLASTLAERLTDELVEMLLDGDEGAEKAQTVILADQIHKAKIKRLMTNIRSARRAGDTETMTANIEKLKIVEPEYPEIYTEELWVLMIDEQWPDAVAYLNEMSASWAKDTFVSMNGMKMARRDDYDYSDDFEKALVHSYSDFVHNKEYVGPNHFACLSILQWRIDEKENATTTVDKMIEAAEAFSNGQESKVAPYVRFKEAVHDGTMPALSDLMDWLREARSVAKPAT